VEQDECHDSRSLTRWKCQSQRELHESPWPTDHSFLPGKSYRSGGFSGAALSATPDTRTETIDEHRGIGMSMRDDDVVSSRSPRLEAAGQRRPRRVEERQTEDCAGKSYRLPPGGLGC